MCGIAGVIGSLRDADEERCRQMMFDLRHRGPDASGFWRTPGQTRLEAILVHRRLSIIDLRDVASQPMVNPATGTALVFNGEIYNFRDLRRELQQSGTEFTTDGDSEVVLKGFDRWGVDLFRRLRGMFAIALVRGGEAVLARDGYGIKPLYWSARTDAEGGRALAFASETRALVNAGYARRQTDPWRIASYLWNGFVPGPQSIWTDVHEVPRGSYAVIKSASQPLRFKKFWSIGTALSADPSSSAEQADAAVSGSVAAHLEADVPRVVFLSGGVDSTAVAAAAVRAGGPLATLSIGFTESEADESGFAEGAAKAIGSIHSVVRLAPDDVLGSIGSALNALDQPSFDAINSWFVSREAVRNGYKVALAGSGGDELVGGYSSFRRAAAAAPWMRIPGSQVFASVGGSIAGRVWPASKAGELGAAFGDWVKMYQTQYALFDRRTLSSLVINPEAAPAWGLSDTRLEQLQALVEGLSPWRAVTALESELFLGDRLLRDTDSVSMAHSLEVRLPLVDTVLSDEFGSLPDAERYLPLGEKRVLRRQARDVLDEGFFARPKRGFEFPMDVWMRGPLRELIEQTILEPSACKSVGLNPVGVSGLWRRFLNPRGGVYWTRPWAIYALLRWAEANNAKCD